MLKKEVMSARSYRIEGAAIGAAIVALLAALSSGCAVDDALTRREACQEQAEAWCARIGHSNESCERWYAYRCAPSGVNREASVELTWQNACLDAIACEVDGLNHTPPHECTMLWNRP